MVDARLRERDPGLYRLRLKQYDSFDKFRKSNRSHPNYYMSNKKYKSTDFYRSLTLQDNLLHENMNLLHDCRSFSDLKPWYRSLSRASTTRYTCDLYSSSGSLGGCLSTYDSLNWMDPFHSLKFEKRYRAADHLVILKP